MYFNYDDCEGIHVEYPYKRVMTPMMMPDTADAPLNYSVHMTEWEPGSQVDDHLHPDAMETMFCIAGHGKASCNGQEYDLVPGSMITAAPGEMHCIKNTGDELLRCVCIFSPPTTAEGLRKRAEEAVEESKRQNQKQ